MLVNVKPSKITYFEELLVSEDEKTNTPNPVALLLMI